MCVAAFPCSLLPIKPHPVRGDFSVVIKHREKPIAGIHVKVYSIDATGEPATVSEPVLAADSDEQGTVLIRGLYPGRYKLTAERGGIEAGDEWLEVAGTTDTKTEKVLELEWAGDPYETRTVAGTLKGLVPGNTGNQLQDTLHPKEVSFSGVHLTLRNVFTEVEYRTVSDSEGKFAFDQISDGIYVLKIKGGMKSVYGVAGDSIAVVDVVSTAVRDSLPLVLKAQGCYGVAFQLHEQ